MTKASDVFDEKNQEILKLLAAGRLTKDISKIVFLSRPAIHWRIQNMIREMNCKNIVHLCVTAVKEGVI